jgi:hypothetical protein
VRVSKSTPWLDADAVLTCSGQHPVSRKYGIGTSHEAQGLFRLAHRVSSGSQSDDGGRKHYASRGDGSNQGVVWNGLVDDAGLITKAISNK